jgi:hypothetical protein
VGKSLFTEVQIIGIIKVQGTSPTSHLERSRKTLPSGGPVWESEYHPKYTRTERGTTGGQVSSSSRVEDRQLQQPDKGLGAIHLFE